MIRIEVPKVPHVYSLPASWCPEDKVCCLGETWLGEAQQKLKEEKKL